MEETSLRLSVTDAGKGITPDFIRHSLFDAFTQEDPHVDGTGLGLSLVKRTVTTLGGDILVDSKKSCGSTFTATFPSYRMILGLSRETPGFSSNNLESVIDELPQLEMSLFTPRRWEAGDTIRGRRCTEMMSASFTRVLNRWFQTTVIPWDTPSTHSRLLFVLHEDLEHVTQTHGDVFANTKCIVLCPDEETSFSSYITSSQDTTRIDGSVSVSKLQDALARLFPTKVSSSGFQTSPEQELTALDDQEPPLEVGKESMEQLVGDTVQDPSPRSLSNLVVRSKHQEDGNNASVGSEAFSKPTPEPSDKAIPTVSTDNRESNGETQAQPKAAIEASSAVPSDNAIIEPKLLLVDDNAVNLKVLSMYARKCSKTPSTSVGGGQEAIDVFNASLDDGENASQPFDLIFLDLSMPEVSGFDVAKEIRETEARLQCKARTYICALTGLVSAKDRNAAYASGVDDYLVKPAKLKDLQHIVEKWRRSLRSE
jgi:CheY-like chemotaxis protein